MTRISINALDGTNTQDSNGLQYALHATLTQNGDVCLGDGMLLNLQDYSIRDIGIARHQDDLILFLPDYLANKINSQVSSLRIRDFFCHNNQSIPTSSHRAHRSGQQNRVIRFREGLLSATKLMALLTQQIEILDKQSNERLYVDIPEHGKLCLSPNQAIILSESFAPIQYTKQDMNLKLTYSGGSIELLNNDDQHHDLAMHQSIFSDMTTGYQDQENGFYEVTLEAADEDDECLAVVSNTSGSKVDDILNDISDMCWGIDEDIDMFDKMYQPKQVSPLFDKKLDNIKPKPHPNETICSFSQGNNIHSCLQHNKIQRAEQPLSESKTKQRKTKPKDSDFVNHGRYHHFAAEEYFIGGVDDEGMPWDVNPDIFFAEGDGHYVESQDFSLTYTSLLNEDVISLYGEVLQVDGAGVELDIVNLEYELLQSVEIIDMTGYGGNSLNISLDQDYHVNNRELYIYGDETTTIRLSGEHWEQETSVPQEKFQCYKLYNVTLFIDSKIHQVILYG